VVVIAGTLTKEIAGGLSAVLADNAATLLIAAMTVLRPPAVSARQEQRWTARGLLSGIASGLSYARRAADVRALLAVVSASTLANSRLFAVALPAFTRSSGHGSLALGALVACGVGTAAGRGLGRDHRTAALLVCADHRHSAARERRVAALKVTGPIRTYAGPSHPWK
jgi:hypothetical protein